MSMTEQNNFSKLAYQNSQVNRWPNSGAATEACSKSSGLNKTRNWAFRPLAYYLHKRNKTM